MITNRADRVVLTDVEVVEHGDLTVRCRIGSAVVSIPPLHMLPGSTVSYPGDRGRLVLTRELAVQFKLA